MQVPTASLKQPYKFLIRFSGQKNLKELEIEVDLNQASYKTLKEVIAKKTGIAEKYQDLKMFDGHWNGRKDLKYYIDNVN